MPINNFLAVGLAGATMLAAMPAAATVTFNDAVVSANVYSSVNAYRAGGGTRSKSGSRSGYNQAYSVPTGTLTSSASYTASVTGASAQSSSTSSIAFTSASAGTFSLQGLTTATVSAATLDDGNVSSANANGNGYSAYYDFTVDSLTKLTLSFTSSGFSTAYPNATSDGYYNYAGFSLYSGDAGVSFGENVQGTDTRIYYLNPGAYQLSANIGNTYYGGAYANQYGVGTSTTYLRGTVGFALAPAVFARPALVAAVPEPANWAIMIGGIGLIGGVARRRRGATPVAVAA